MARSRRSQDRKTPARCRGYKDGSGGAPDPSHSACGTIFFDKNDDDRYHWNGTTASRNDDGTFTFTFKTDCQTSDLNCLEVPEGQFDLVPMYYLPSDEIISGQWTFPKIERISD